MSDSAKPYASPTVTTLGSLADLTLAFNKIGTHHDIYSRASQGAIVGKLTPLS